MVVDLQGIRGEERLVVVDSGCNKGETTEAFVLPQLHERLLFFSFENLTKISKRWFNKFLVCEKRTQLKRHEELAREGYFFMPIRGR